MMKLRSTLIAVAASLVCAATATLASNIPYFSGPPGQLDAYSLVNQLIQKINTLGGIGTITPNPTIVWSGPATNPPAFQPFYINENLSGLSTAPGGSLLNQNSIEITDNLNTGAENTLAQGLFVDQKVGANAYGSRQAVVGQVVVGHTTDSNPGSSLPGYVGATSVVIAAGNVGGTGLTSGTASGGIYGINPNVQAQPGATNFFVVNGGEFDVQIFSGASSLEKYGISIVQGANDMVQGTGDDMGIVLANQGGAVGWQCGLCFGHSTGAGWPMYPGTGENTTLIKTFGANTMDYGIDLSATTFRTDSFKAPNFAVTNTGTVQAVAASFSSSSGSALTFSNAAGGISFRNGGTFLASPAANVVSTESLALNAVAPTVTTGQIGLGGSVAAASNCGSLASAAGCLVINVAGTTRYVPYY